MSSQTSDAVDDDSASEEEADSGPVLTLTQSAIDQVLELRASEDDGDQLGLRVEITGANGTDFSYDLAFWSLDEIADDDDVSQAGELPVIIPAATVPDLRGATLDLPADSDNGGLVLRNPNRPNPLMGPSVELSGTVEERVRQLLDGSINPALAAHGGYAALVRVEEPKAFVTMGGGCQGCAVSAMTLRDGIQSAIVDAVPEITEVVDLTDHDAGENPFY